MGIRENKKHAFSVSNTNRAFPADADEEEQVNPANTIYDTHNDNHDKSTLSMNDAYSDAGTNLSESEVDEVEQIKNLSSKETSTIRFWRIVVTLVIIGVGALVSTGTFFYIRGLEQKDASDAFVLFSNTIEDLSRFHFLNMFEASRAMSRELTAAAMLAKETFPFVTFPNYEVYATQAREAAGLEVISYAPVVTKEQADAFVNYTIANQKWIADTRRLGMALDPTLNFHDIDNTTFKGTIYDNSPLAAEPIPTESDGPYAPFWHASPPPDSLVYFMYNFASNPGYAAIFSLIEQYRDTLFGNPNFYLETVVDFLVTKDKHIHLHEMRHKDDDMSTFNATQLHGALVQPVFSSFENDAPVAGYLMGVMAFDAYLKDLLPDGVSGIFVVIENTCANVFTYRLNGNHAEWLGVGDLHQQRFNYLERTVKFDDYYHSPEVVKEPGHCVFSYRLYPSDEFNSAYNSHLPVLLTTIVAVLFIIMAVAFLVLMYFVEKRQKKVVGEAAISNAIVSSLFPSSVRKRLFADRAALLPQEASESGKSALRSFLKGEEQELDGVILKAKPIADSFCECTIMFADIAGFTSWSSSREPAEVFTLLESCYRAFDAIAAQKRVFKVETIGDCYVAVCGLPVPRKMHAVVMAEFARACLKKMNMLVQVLAGHLGSDTTSLDFRVGLHSGKVTAGVLRGERSRFQLFGDTVNTAARMESNGCPGRIHISETTSAKLEDAGKSHWFTPRSEMVFVKGKGEMQTFWLTTTTPKTDANSVPESAPDVAWPQLKHSSTGVTRSTDTSSGDMREDVEV